MVIVDCVMTDVILPPLFGPMLCPSDDIIGVCVKPLYTRSSKNEIIIKIRREKKPSTAICVCVCVKMLYRKRESDKCIALVCVFICIRNLIRCV